MLTMASDATIRAIETRISDLGYKRNNMSHRLWSATMWSQSVLRIKAVATFGGEVKK